MDEEEKRVPLFHPLLTLLRSRKFLVAVITLIVDILIVYLPALEPVQTELITVITVVCSVLIASIAYEDGQAREKV